LRFHTCDVALLLGKIPLFIPPITVANSLFYINRAMIGSCCIHYWHISSESHS